MHRVCYGEPSHSKSEQFGETADLSGGLERGSSKHSCTIEQIETVPRNLQLFSGSIKTRE